MKSQIFIQFIALILPSRIYTALKDKFKKMKSQVDFVKIFDESKKQPDGTYKLLGVLNVNNMIPASKEVLEKVDLAIHKKDSVEIKRAKILGSSWVIVGEKHPQPQHLC